MQTTWKRLLSVGLALILVFSGLASPVLAGASDGTVTGTYSYSSNEYSNKQLEDSFVWRDECFQQSSFLGCEHLKLLSAQASIASASRFGVSEDLYERIPDGQNCGQNILDMLNDMGFLEVETNGYYQTEALENSAAVAVGYRTISVEERDYTLLAIIPRSAGYKQEWVGNFTVGEGLIHEGFKAARDEILRFVKRYLSAHGITGALKVWIAGHSRGAAVANLLGGFFAGGGIACFGDSVSITPEDVYCYTFATPRTIIAGLSKDVELSVAGNRAGDYFFDTEQEPYVYSGGGTVDPEAAEYGGIRNFPFSYDFITYLPLREWGYTYYGGVCAMDQTLEGEPVSVKSMERELQTLSPYAYQRWLNGGDYRTYADMDFELAELRFVPQAGAATGAAGMTAYVTARMAGLARAISRETYTAEGYQDMMAAVAGLYGMTVNQFGSQLRKASGELVRAGLLSYLAYASGELLAENRAADETEALAVELAELLDYFTGERSDPETLTVDAFLELALTYLADHPDSPLTQKLIARLVKKLPAPDQEFLRKVLWGCVPGFTPSGDDPGPSLEVTLVYLLRAASTGPVQGSGWAEKETMDSGAEVRSFLYAALQLLPDNSDFIPEEILDALSGDGQKPLSALADAIRTLLLRDTGADGEAFSYASFDEAANARLLNTLRAVADEVLSIIRTGQLYGETFTAAVEKHADALMTPERIRMLRSVLCSMMFEPDGAPFDTGRNVQSVATLFGNLGKVPPAHYNEVFIAWAKAVFRQPEPVDSVSAPEPAVAPAPVPDRPAPIPDQPAACPKDASCPVSAFDDTGATEWYHDGVHFVLEKGVMQGMGKGKFGPDTAISRAMMAQILYNLEERPAVSAASPFDDVRERAWYASAVSWAAANGLMNGYSDGGFGPNDDLTREQLVAILYRYTQYKGAAEDPGTDGLSYDDAAEISEWAVLPFRWAVYHGIVQGTGGSRLSPKANASRAEIATMLMRYLTGVGAAPEA